MKFVSTFVIAFPPLSWALSLLQNPSVELQRAYGTFKQESTLTALAPKTIGQEHSLAFHHPQPYNLCWVHIGKSGGESITIALNVLKRQHALNFVQVHSDHNRFGNTSLGGPLEGEGMEVCKKANRTLIWIRDPISRLISCWNAMEQKALSKVAIWLSTHGIDVHATLDDILSTLVYRSDFALVHDLFDLVEHANWGASFYFGESCEALDQLPIHFVGRQEYMVDDWDKFLYKTTNVTSCELPHTHHTHFLGQTLSSSVVTFLRGYYAADYRCIQKLSDMGHLSPDYVETISSSESYEFIKTSKAV